MPVIELEDIHAVIQRGGEVICSDCIEKDPKFWDHFDKDEDRLILESDIDDNARIYICDRCGEIIK